MPGEDISQHVFSSIFCELEIDSLSPFIEILTAFKYVNFVYLLLRQNFLLMSASCCHLDHLN